MMRLALLLALAGLASPSAAQPPAPDCPGGRTVSATTLRAAGVGRLDDALRLVAPVYGWTVDGFDAEPRDGRGALSLLVDGRPWRSGTDVEPGALDALPVAVSELDAVVYCPGPRLVWGRAVGATLNLLTVPPTRVAALVDYGNETGDPGPARYQDRDLPNQDHWGPDAEVVGRAGPVWAMLRKRSFLPTDTAIVARTAPAFGQFPDVDRVQAAAAVRTRLGDATLDGRTGLTVGEALPFLPYAQHEVALDRRAVSGAAEVRRGRWALLASGDLHRLRGPSRATIPDSLRARDYDQARVDLALAAAVGDGHELGIAVGADVLRTPEITYRSLGQFSPPVTADESTTLATIRAWTRLRWLDGRGTLDLSALTDGGRPGGGAHLRVPMAGLTLTAGARVAPVRTAPLEYGFGPLRQDTTATQRRQRSDASAFDLRLDGGWTRRAVGVQWSASAWRARSPRLSVRLTRRGTSLFFRPTVEHGVRGDAAVGWQRGALRLGADLAVQAVRYAAPSGLSESSEFVTDHAAPALAAGTTAQWTPSARLALHARLEAATERLATAGTVAAPRSGRVPGGVVLDLGLRRSVWGDRLALALVGHNVLGAPEQPALLGARLGPRLHVRLMARL